VARQTIEFLGESRMKRAPHSPYSPNLAPSDFYFFGYIIGCLADCSFEDRDALFAAIQHVLEGIEKSTLRAVFGESMERLGRCITTDCEYVE
jgi:hypothetical protein